MNKAFFAMSAGLMLTACGGGGSGGSSNPPPPPLRISLSASSGSASATEGNTQTTLTTTATLTGTIPSGAIADVQYDNTVFASVTATAGATNGTYTITAQTLPDLGGGDYNGNITFRLCREVACTSVHANSATTYSYNINVKLQDWQTFQRNAAHTGYVHVTLDPSKFAKAWEWRMPDGSGQYDGVNSISTGGGHVYLTRDDYFMNPGSLFALKEEDGSQVWMTDLPNIASASPPTYSKGKIFVSAVVSSGNSKVYVYNATNGAFLFTSPFASQWSNLAAPTPYDDNLYVAAGYYGGETSSHSQSTGDVIWRSYDSQGGAWGGQTPAVDQNYVYYMGINGLTVFDRGSGTTYASINNPLGGWNGYDYNGSAMLGSEQSVIAFTGLASSGWALSSSHASTPRGLARYDIASKSIRWHSSQAYFAIPAYTKNTIYTARNNPARFDALNESDGSIAWSWTPPSTDTSFTRNVVVTKNLAFVSTNRAVYAIDLSTHQSVWSYPVSGALAISPGYKLYVQEISDNRSNGKITVISLK